MSRCRAGDLIRTADPEGRVQTFVYDTYGYVKELPDPEDTVNRITRLQWDAGGRLLKRTDPLGNETIYTYNAANQVLSITAYPKKSDQSIALVTTYTYDKVGNQKTVSVVVSAGETRATTTLYDPNGNVATVTEGAGSNTKTTEYGYDGEDRLRRVTIPGLVPQVTTYTYDPIGRVEEVIEPQPDPAAPVNTTTRYGYTDSGLAAPDVNRHVKLTRWQADKVDPSSEACVIPLTGVVCERRADAECGGLDGHQDLTSPGRLDSADRRADGVCAEHGAAGGPRGAPARTTAAPADLVPGPVQGLSPGARDGGTVLGGAPVD